MTHAHNLLLRGLNAIIQQGPHVPDSTSPNYREKDVRDFLTYVHIWIETVHHHHWVEETYIFPEMEKSSGKPGLMDEPQHQHELFQEGLNSLKEYTSSTKPDEYRWEDSNGNGMKKIIDSFSKHLTDHLYAEIEVFLGLKDLDSAQFKKTWNKAEEIAKASGNIGLLVSFLVRLSAPLAQPLLLLTTFPLLAPLHIFTHAECDLQSMGKLTHLNEVYHGPDGSRNCRQDVCGRT